MAPRGLSSILVEFGEYGPKSILDGVKLPKGACETKDAPNMIKMPQNPAGKKKRRYLLQKYIERPMIINKRKFDIRQWVVVTSFKPGAVRCWFYLDAYLRFASREYGTTDGTESGGNAWKDRFFGWGRAD